MTRGLYISTLLAILCLFGAEMKAQGHGAVPFSDCQVYVPNAFTPNDDGINERFVIKYNDDCKVVEYDMKVFDRWGRLVFEADSEDYQSAWDGTESGQELREGVYMWKVNAKMVNPSNPDNPHLIEQKGTVVLIR